MKTVMYKVARPVFAAGLCFALVFSILGTQTETAHAATCSEDEINQQVEQVQNTVLQRENEFRAKDYVISNDPNNGDKVMNYTLIKGTGYAKVTKTNGDTFEGDYVNYRMEGYAEVHYVERQEDIYLGQYKNGERSGWGIYTYGSGEVYKGQYSAGKKNGCGIELNQGEKYIGEFKNGKPNGFGTVTAPVGYKLLDGVTLSGIFQDGSLTGQGTMNFKNNAKFIGEFENSIAIKGNLYIGSDEISVTFEKGFFVSKPDSSNKGNPVVYYVKDGNLQAYVSVIIDGVWQKYDNPAVIMNGSTLVPLRPIFEKLGAVIQWDNETRTVTATKNNKTIKLTIGSTMAYVNGEKNTLSTEAQIINNATMVPVRFVSEALGAEVKWDEKSKSVEIKSNPVE
ncbi:Uncharacterized conserved protein [Paenibacillus sp. yr247]|uniref:stalk domain-containing protein n=1 Tax=Paenibacillus sp. yr247 TaxID=1761880 RepID=UPI00088A02AB|nr:stalk domain-containing protein [Paenibacillus sp. yr247]SDP29194.1 Uncharacterized conserved protein [Paenibacillus sp. yr247]